VAKSKLAILEIVAMDATGTPMKLGTGFFVSPDGLAVTNFHVIDGATSLVATSSDGAMFLLQRIVCHPPGVDLVVLQRKADGVPFLSLGESADKFEGGKVIVIGNPTGLIGTVSDGIYLSVPRKSFVYSDHSTDFSWLQRLSGAGRRRKGYRCGDTNECRRTGFDLCDPGRRSLCCACILNPTNRRL
jgi:S1-C subfamily serine protease